MSKEIYLYSEDKKYKCAVELANTFDRFGCPDHSVIILTEERPDGTYVIAQARDRILETEKDKKIADLQHRLNVAEKALELACKYNIPDDEFSHITLRFSDTGVQVENWQELKEYALKQAKSELKGE